MSSCAFGARPWIRSKSFCLEFVSPRLQYLLFTGSIFSVSSLGAALLIAAGFISFRHLRKRGELPLPVLWRALFPRRIVRHRSARFDLGYFVFNSFVYGSTFGLAGNLVPVSHQRPVAGPYRRQSGRVTPSACRRSRSARVVTVVLFLAYELGYWIDHYLKHHVPVLWELHKVHHTAEVLTPLDTFRMHPLDLLVFGQILR